MGTQWTGMGREMMQFPQFRRTIKKCAAVLEPLGVNILDMVTNGDETTFENTLNCFTVITGIQASRFLYKRLFLAAPTSNVHF